MKVKIKKLHRDAVIPKYAKEGDAGLDLVAIAKSTNSSYQAVYSTGLAVEIPKGFVGLLFPRSSIRNKELLLSNSVGVIDSGYRGDIQVTFKKTGGLDSIDYKIGDKIAQLIIIPYPPIEFELVEELSNSERGEGGFGHTGN